MHLNAVLMQEGFSMFQEIVSSNNGLCQRKKQGFINVISQ